MGRAFLVTEGPRWDSPSDRGHSALGCRAGLPARTVPAPRTTVPSSHSHADAHPRATSCLLSFWLTVRRRLLPGAGTSGLGSLSCPGPQPGPPAHFQNCGKMHITMYHFKVSSWVTFSTCAVLSSRRHSPALGPKRLLVPALGLRSAALGTARTWAPQEAWCCFSLSSTFPGPIHADPGASASFLFTASNIPRSLTPRQEATGWGWHSFPCPLAVALGVPDALPWAVGFPGEWGGPCWLVPFTSLEPAEAYES